MSGELHGEMHAAGPGLENRPPGSGPHVRPGAGSERLDANGPHRADGGNMNLTDSEMVKLENTKSAVEWNMACDDIKRARGGQYPPDWFDRIVVSGQMSRALRNWTEPNPAGSAS